MPVSTRGQAFGIHTEKPCSGEPRAQFARRSLSLKVFENAGDKAFSSVPKRNISNPLRGLQPACSEERANRSAPQNASRRLPNVMTRQSLTGSKLARYIRPVTMVYTDRKVGHCTPALRARGFISRISPLSKKPPFGRLFARQAWDFFPPCDSLLYSSPTKLRRSEVGCR